MLSLVLKHISKDHTLDSIFTIQPLLHFYMQYLRDYHAGGLFIDFYLVNLVKIGSEPPIIRVARKTLWTSMNSNGIGKTRRETLQKCPNFICTSAVQEPGYLDISR